MDNFVRFDSKKKDIEVEDRQVKEPAVEERVIERHAPKRHKKSGKKSPVAALVVAAVVVIGGLVAFSVYQYKQAEYLKTPEGVAEIAKKDSDELVSKVSQLIKLPDEEAVVATVDDKDKLREQPFFVDVENGDKVLIFSAASRAVIYRPSENRIINSGPIAITAEDAAADEQPAVTE
jgi:cytoskeletal protein RodZ